MLLIPMVCSPCSKAPSPMRLQATGSEMPGLATERRVFRDEARIVLLRKLRKTRLGTVLRVVVSTTCARRVVGSLCSSGDVGFVDHRSAAWLTAQCSRQVFDQISGTQSCRQDAE